MATEWFGIDESEGEGAFCAFIDRIHDESEVGADIANKRRLMPQPFAKITPAKNDVLLFFDDQHPNYSDEYLDELSKLFPDATIFDGNLKILRTPNYTNGRG